MRLRTRQILPEVMDDETPEIAQRSMRDIERINSMFGGNRLTRILIDAVAPEEPFTVLDVGAGGGQSSRVIRDRRPRARVTSLDYRVHQLAPAPFPKLAADAFHLPFNDRSFDVVFCSLFLHHFANPDVIDLLRSFGRVARTAVLINDLERHWLACRFLPATRFLFGWQPVTLHDGPASVRASFTAAELRNLCEQAGLDVIFAQAYRPAFRIAVAARPVA